MDKQETVYIGIAGRAGSGKDPAAQIIAGDMHGPTTIIALATGLKQMLAAHYGLAWGGTQAQYLFYTKEGKMEPSPNPLKPGNTVRQDLMDLGDTTRAINQDIWVTDTIYRGKHSRCQFVLVPDVRYPNELKHMDYAIWVGPDTPGEHGTENALTSADFSETARFMQDTVVGRLVALRAYLGLGRDWKADWAVRHG